jgi:hypothetical protein
MRTGDVPVLRSRLKPKRPVTHAAAHEIPSIRHRTIGRDRAHQFDDLVCEYFIGPDQKPCGAANPWKALVVEEFMIRTPICDLFDIEHPIALGGMGSATSPALVAAVSRAGGHGALGCHYLTPDQIQERAAAIRQETKKPFGLNFLTLPEPFAAS